MPYDRIIRYRLWLYEAHQLHSLHYTILHISLRITFIAFYNSLPTTENIMKYRPADDTNWAYVSDLNQ